MTWSTRTKNKTRPSTESANGTARSQSAWESSKRLLALSEKLDGQKSSIPPILQLTPRYQKIAKAVTAVIVGVAIAIRIIMEMF